MKFEFEIPDKTIKDIVSEHTKNLCKHEHTYARRGLKSILEAETDKAIRDFAFNKIISQKISDKSEAIINEAIDNKLRGFVNRKVKESIKLLSMDVQFVAENYDDSLGCREPISQTAFSNPVDAISFVQAQKHNGYPWSIEVDFSGVKIK